MRPPDLTHQLIYRNPHAYCAWPDIKILHDGDWVLAFCETMRRPTITHLDPNLLNMLLRSEDGGQSWTGPQVIAGYDFSGMDDPGMVQLSNGVLLVNTARNSFVSLDTADADAAYAGYDRRPGFAWASSYPIAEGTYVHRSEDGGRTWSGSARVNVSPFVSGYTLRPITELEDGSLLLPCYDESQVPCPSFVVPSYDQGRTWTGASLIALDDNDRILRAGAAGPAGRARAGTAAHAPGGEHPSLPVPLGRRRAQLEPRAADADARPAAAHAAPAGWTPAVRLRPPLGAFRGPRLPEQRRRRQLGYRERDGPAR